METEKLRFAEFLKSHNQSVTKARLAIYQALSGQEAQTMAELTAVCENTVDRASVYRTIELFEKLGVVHRLQMGWKYKLELTDRFSHHHHHMTCSRCGAIIALPEDELLEDRLRELASSHHFSIGNHQIEISGLCQKCDLAENA